MTSHCATLSLVTLTFFVPAWAFADGVATQWGQWRGPLGTGVAPQADPPVEWSEDRNIRWKIPLPGRGHSSPVVWDQRIFLTTAIPYGETLPHPGHDSHGHHDNVRPEQAYEFVVMAIDRRDGRILWQRTVAQEQPHESTHETGTWASNSAVTDGERVYASFGSRGVYCLDLDGTILWQVDPGDMRIRHGHGEGSTAALHGDTLILNWDHEGASFVQALDTRTGREIWRAARDEGTSWSSPLVVEHAGRKQVIIAATNRVRAYDLASGDVVWECGGLSGNVVATPVAGDGYVYVTNSYETREMLAIRLADARGDITGTAAVAWTRHRDTPYVPSPLLYGDRLYFLKHYQGYLTCVDAKTGKPLFARQRLPEIGNVYASLVGAAGRIYIVDRNGATVVLKHGDKLEVLARNQLDDSFSATPALVGRELILRGERFLYSVSK